MTKRAGSWRIVVAGVMAAMLAGAVLGPRPVYADDDEPIADASKGQLAVTVVDEDGKAITDGVAMLGDPGKKTTHRRISLGVGTPVFEVDEGTYWLKVEANCYAPVTLSKVEVAGGAQREVKVTMRYTCGDDVPIS